MVKCAEFMLCNEQFNRLGGIGNMAMVRTGIIEASKAIMETLTNINMAVSKDCDKAKSDLCGNNCCGNTNIMRKALKNYVWV